MPPLVNPERIDAYERSLISAGLLASDLVAGAVEVPPEKLAVIIPAPILDSIRWFVTDPAETWIDLRSGCSRVAFMEPTQAEELQFWLQGLAMWREYFEGLGA